MAGRSPGRTLGRCETLTQHLVHQVGSEPTDKIVPFPPLPPRPEPPRLPPDERQAAFLRIASVIADVADDGFQVGVANTVSGFPASAVDVRRLKAALESGIADFTMDLVRQRWDGDVAHWLRRTALSWVQRCKSLRLDKREKGVRVEIETQDDLGYYTYAFDVLPGRKSE